MVDLNKYITDDVQDKQKLLTEYSKKYDSVRNMINRIGKLHVIRDKKIKEKGWGDVADLERIEKDLQDILKYWR